MAPFIPAYSGPKTISKKIINSKGNSNANVNNKYAIIVHTKYTTDGMNTSFISCNTLSFITFASNKYLASMISKR